MFLMLLLFLDLLHLICSSSSFTDTLSILFRCVLLHFVKPEVDIFVVCPTLKVRIYFVLSKASFSRYDKF